MNRFGRNLVIASTTILLMPAILGCGKAISQLNDPLAFYKQQAGAIVCGILPGNKTTENAADADNPEIAGNPEGAENAEIINTSGNAGTETASDGAGKPNDAGKDNNESNAADPDNNPDNAAGSTGESAGQNAAEESKPAKKSFNSDLSNTLFIGDSRSVGIQDYGGIDEADFFVSTGLTVYKLDDTALKVKGVGKVTLKQLLAKKTYDKIFIMLGINELGYDRTKTMEKYKELVETVRKDDPDAVVFLGANLHVTKKKGADSYINNKNINALNAEIEKLADDNNIYYLDANTIFDDASGNLDPEKTVDEAHVLGKYYQVWGQWIRDQIGELAEKSQS